MRLWRLFPLGIFLMHAPLFAVITPKLDRIMVRINGSEKEVANKGRLELIRGDDITLLYAVLEGSKQAPDIINFVGYRGDGPRRWADDDRDILIPTVNLKKGWSLDKTGKTYKVETKTGNRVHGEVLVSILTPELVSLKLDVKGQPREVRAGDHIEMRPDDPIQIRAVKTNSPIVDQHVRAEFKDMGKQVELRLLYRSYVFATIYLDSAGAE